MGRRFILSGENLTLGTGNVLAALQTAAAGAAGSWLKLLRVECDQSHNTTPAQQRFQMATRDTAGTLTVTSATPANLTLGGPASGIAGNTNPIGATARCGVNSSADSGGTYTAVWPIANNNQAGLLWLPTPDEQIMIPPSTVWVARFLATPSDGAGWNIKVVYEELY